MLGGILQSLTGAVVRRSVQSVNVFIDHSGSRRAALERNDMRAAV